MILCVCFRVGRPGPAVPAHKLWLHMGCRASALSIVGVASCVWHAYSMLSSCVVNRMPPFARCHALRHLLRFQVGADGQYETFTMFSCLESVGVLEVVRCAACATHLLAPCWSATQHAAPCWSAAHHVVPLCTYCCVAPRAAGYCDVVTAYAYTQLHKRPCPRVPRTACICRPARMAETHGRRVRIRPSL